MNKRSPNKFLLVLSIFVLAALALMVFASNRSQSRLASLADTPQMLGPQSRVNSLLAGLFQAFSPNQPQEPDFSISGPQEGPEAYAASFDGDLRDLPQIGPSEKKPMRELAMPPDPDAIEDPDFIDPVLQEGPAGLAMPAYGANFAGLDLNTWGAGWPPDTNGDVGPNHYIQTVNTSIGVYNKSGSRLAAFTFNSFFDGTGTPCDAANQGDPVVLYDAISGRWMITDFAWTDFVNGPYYECIAVSKNADPVSGGWWMYGLQADSTWLNDYPKLGVWADGIYMSANMFDILNSAGSASFTGVKVWALNRDDLINGAALRNRTFSLLGNSYGSLLPSNLLGALPPAGEPAFFGSIAGPSTFRLWKFYVDWATPTNSTFTGPTNIAIASFSNPSSVPQSGGIALDTLAGRLMMQLQYRNLNGTESLWATHSVASGGVSGIRWYEIRNPNGSPSVYQQGTFQPDTSYRWMGSLAVDQQGNMAVGYSVSSSSMFPAIRYAGRLAGDPLGQLSQGESTLIAGTGAQTSYNRWGDYSAMNVDPTDGCTFWYTTEYYLTTGTNWQTRIGSFKFPGCGSSQPQAPVAVATGSPTSGNAPLTVNFSSAGSYDPDGNIASYAWTFGDGGTSTLDNPSHTYTTPESYTTVLTVTDNTGMTGTDSAVTNVTAPPASTMHVGDLVGSTTTSRGKWNATVTITVHDANHALLSGVTVTGTWSNGGSGSCTTLDNGTCKVTKANIKSTVASVTFTVTNLSKTGNTYTSSENHKTSIPVYRQ